jgi:hypothetical protein
LGRNDLGLPINLPQQHRMLGMLQQPLPLITALVRLIQGEGGKPRQMLMHGRPMQVHDPGDIGDPASTLP